MTCTCQVSILRHQLPLVSAEDQFYYCAVSQVKLYSGLTPSPLNWLESWNVYSYCNWYGFSFTGWADIQQVGQKLSLSTLGVRPPSGQGIRILMLNASMIDNIKWVFLKYLQPSNHLAFRLFKCLKPLEWALVNTHPKLTTQKVWLKLLDKGHGYQEFLPWYTEPLWGYGLHMQWLFLGHPCFMRVDPWYLADLCWYPV